MLCTSWSTVPQCLEKIISPSSTTFDDIYENLTNVLLRRIKTIQWFEHKIGKRKPLNSLLPHYKKGSKQKGKSEQSILTKTEHEIDKPSVFQFC